MKVGLFQVPGNKNSNLHCGPVTDFFNYSIQLCTLVANRMLKDISFFQRNSFDLLLKHSDTRMQTNQLSLSFCCFLIIYCFSTKVETREKIRDMDFSGNYRVISWEYFPGNMSYMNFREMADICVDHRPKRIVETAERKKRAPQVKSLLSYGCGCLVIIDATFQKYLELKVSKLRL